jgi:hypothetical protein
MEISYCLMTQKMSVKVTVVAVEVPLAMLTLRMALPPKEAAKVVAKVAVAEE